MAADLDAIIRDIESCYDFAGKSVIHVGAGGGQLIGYASRARSVLGVDTDAAAVQHLEEAVRRRGLADRFRARRSDVLELTENADVVFFEFCLHEIPQPHAALRHARALAPEVLIADHAPGSRWSWLCGEPDEVRRAWDTVECFPRALDRSFAGAQLFQDHAELAAKVGALGAAVLRRAEEFAACRDFRIDMPYRVALLRG